MTNRQFTPADILDMRSRLGESQSIFGKRFSVSGMTVWRWEAGETTPKAAYMEILAGIDAKFTEEAVKARYGMGGTGRRYS